ncbi:carbohydrate ABC transporter permease [Peterkaempfera sp. SMS 1(5)a]|uniref:carbohydrate ABC transporter permease n=1 Tax=Peterkaempfera podocarpi TaxID=3232308 RepID=UPI00366DB574
MTIVEGAAPAAPVPAKRRRRLRTLTVRDRVTLSLMGGVPTLITVGLVWIPALASVVLSFASWSGFGDLSTIRWVGLDNYKNIFTIYPQFHPAIEHNLVWLAVFFCLPAPFGLFLAVQLDKQIRFSRVYQSILFMPVVLSMALIGFMTELIFSPTQGLLNNLTGHSTGHVVDWMGNPHLNIWAVMVMACWRQAGYVMILFLAGLKSVDPSQKEAAALDGAGGWQTFRHVVWPTLRPINIVVLVVTVIESLRAFDIVYVINKGTNGLELLSVLVTNNIIGEASRIGFGSALATILLLISLAFIVPYLITMLRRDERE